MLNTHKKCLEAALKVLGEDSPEAQPLKEALKKAQDQCRVLPVGERLNSTMKIVHRSQARIEKMGMVVKSKLRV